VLFLTRFRRPPAQARTNAEDAPTTDSPDVQPSRLVPWRLVAARVTTVLAGLLVLFALIVPTDLNFLTPGAFVRIPVEALVGVVLVLVLPVRARKVVAAIGGVALGLLTILKILDMGFLAILDRPFDPLIDWTFLSAGADYLGRSVGRVGEVGAVVGTAVVAIGLLVLLTLSALRLTRLVARRRAPATRTVAVLGAAWVACTVFGVQIVPGVPVAASSAATLAYDSARQVQTDVRNHRTFGGDAAKDAFRYTPGPQLLTGLRGKDVILAFVESYGRVALEDPLISPGVKAVLAAGNDRLRAAGYASRSAFLTSSTYAGGSWLAHSTLDSGMWINSQQLYGDFAASDRFTLNGAFRRAGWRTVDVEPANSKDLPKAIADGYDRVYDERTLGYRGERFNFNSMPDQYTLAAFQRSERAAADRTPVMAQIVMLSSHSPWAPIPQLTGWDNIGEGFGFRAAPAPAGEPSDLLSRNFSQVQTDYGRSIEYSLNTLISYVQTYGDNNLVLIFLGDHQPAATVTGQTAERDVPITIVAHDPAVLDRISGWGWQDGLTPNPQAPVWRMDAFRDRFLTAFGPQSQSAAPAR
jgi:hypothetical protein